MLANNICGRPFCGQTSAASAQSMLLLLLLAPFVFMAILRGELALSGASQMPGNDNAAQRHPVFFSEYKLRSSIETFSRELRDLKRASMRQTNEVYMSLKSDPQVGFERAQRGAPAALAATLLAEQFADILIKSHIIKRRLLTGLRLAFVKFLPIGTLKRLAESGFESFGFLRKAEQVDLRPLFPQARQSQLAQLYNLIALRTRLRAQDDLVTLSAQNARRILQIVERFLVNRKQASYVIEVELNQLAGHATKVLGFYRDQVLGVQRALASAYETQLALAARLVAFAGGRAEFERLLDRLIGAEVLDIDLSAEATRLSLPPTISEPMMANLERKWIPRHFLDSVEESRRILLENKARIASLVRLRPGWEPAELEAKCADAALYICKNYPLNV